jgi:hypothetical protein
LFLFYLRLFPKDSDAVIAYDGARTVSAFSKFIDSNGAEIEPQQVNLNNQSNY